ncbi:MAG: AAA family ATPase [Pseudomonadota bacterium]
MPKDSELPIVDEAPTNPWLRPQAALGAARQALAARAAAYLEAGVAVILCGAPGSGKTALALRLASRRQRPVHVLTGHAALEEVDLVGRITGLDIERTRDRFVHSVVKTRERQREGWDDGPLVRALRDGGTFVFDEITRAPTSVTARLLSVLEERLLVCPSRAFAEPVVAAEPGFAVVFTGNPPTMGGTTALPQALTDRLITLRLPPIQSDEVAEVLAVRTGLAPEACRAISVAVQARQRSTENDAAHSVRPALTVARIVRHHRIAADARDPAFRALVDDVLGPERARTAAGEDAESTLASTAREGAAWQTRSN